MLSFSRSLLPALALLFGLMSWGALAQDLLQVPALTGHVIDITGTLSSGEKEALETRLTEFERAKGSQLVFLMVPSTQPEDIASYANRVGNAWKIGRKGVGDGLLLVVAKTDRKLRIEVAKTLEGAVPDLAAKNIIDSAITPRFKAGDYAGGLNAAADHLIARINGEPLPAPQSTGAGEADGSFDWVNLAVLLFFAVPVAGSMINRLLGRKVGALVLGGGVGAIALFITSSLLIAGIAAFAALVMSLFTGLSGLSRGGGLAGLGGLGAGGWSGGSGGSSSGGGFSSGGGGDFGGGGASGDW
ncbi:MAG: TPM domain-containing protein [Bdellovibrionales bacterium]|nr:TPM domain-containing protein [Ramlibacter sp.]